MDSLNSLDVLESPWRSIAYKRSLIAKYEWGQDRLVQFSSRSEVADGLSGQLGKGTCKVDQHQLGLLL